MFSILARTVPRRALAQPARFMATKPPTKRVKPTPVPKTKAAPAATPADAPAPAPTPAPAPAAPATGQPPLPDAAHPLSSVPTLDFSPPEPETEPKTTGAKSSKGSLSTNERRRRFMSRVSLAVLALGFTAQVVYMGREWEEDELKGRKIKPEDIPTTRWGRTRERFTSLFAYFSEPAWPELLPPPAPAPHQKPYTLLLSLDDLLITSTWDRNNGWRTAKRPGVDYFLAYISQFYEVVIFTTQPSYTANPIIEKLDKYGFFITYRLCREATRVVDGKIVKDLSYLNRDLSKVVLLDTNPDHIVDPDNAIILPKWKGEPGDKGLVGIIPFLESIAIYKPDDVRRVIKAYAGKDVAVEYAKVEAEMKAKHIEEWKAKKGKKASGGLSFGSVVGLSSSTSHPRDQPPPTYLETKRMQAQEHYRNEMKYLQDNKEELERLLAQDQQAMAAQVPGSLWEAVGQFRGKDDAPGAQPMSGAAPAQTEKKA